MKNRLKVKAINGMTVDFSLKDVRGIGTKLNDGTYLSVELIGENQIPIHRDDQRRTVLALYGGKGVKDEKGANI